MDGLPRAAQASLYVDMVRDSEVDLEQFIKIAGLALEHEVRECNQEIMQVIQDLGGSITRYSRERKQGIKNLIVELYSAPRVTAAAKLLPDMRHLPGLALDLTTQDDNGRPWDLSLPDQQEKVWQIIKTQKPELVIGSPMCTMCSIL